MNIEILKGLFTDVIHGEDLSYILEGQWSTKFEEQKDLKLRDVLTTLWHNLYIVV